MILKGGGVCVTFIRQISVVSAGVLVGGRPATLAFASFQRSNWVTMFRPGTGAGMMEASARPA